MDLRTMTRAELIDYAKSVYGLGFTSVHDNRAIIGEISNAEAAKRAKDSKPATEPVGEPEPEKKRGGRRKKAE